MNIDVIGGWWKQARGSFILKWGELTDDSFTRFVGEQDRINGRIQVRLGRLRQSPLPVRRGRPRLASL